MVNSEWFRFLWQATRQRQINNLDLRINHIVQDSAVFPQHVINHPNSTRHCVDWLLIRTDKSGRRLYCTEPGWSLSAFYFSQEEGSPRRLATQKW